MNTYYQASQTKNWQGRTDSPAIELFHQAIQCIDIADLEQHPPIKNAIAFLGFKSDEGVRRNQGRPGAAQGPDSIRHALANMPIDTKHSETLYDCGDIICQDGNLAQSQGYLANAIARLLAHGIQPIVLGGGHEVAWGHYQGIAAANQHQQLGIINFDAHFDLRALDHTAQGSSGTPFLQIAQQRQAQQLKFNYLCLGIQQCANTPSLFNTAKQLDCDYVLAPELFIENNKTYLGLLYDFIKNCEHIYLTLCLDVFAAAHAPGVSSPQALGLNPWQVIPLMKRIIRSGKVISFDIAELAPAYDIDHRTAKLAANLIWEFIHSLWLLN